jgi:hypothetical protein
VSIVRRRSLNEEHTGGSQDEENRLKKVQERATLAEGEDVEEELVWESALRRSRQFGSGLAVRRGIREKDLSRKRREIYFEHAQP